MKRVIIIGAGVAGRGVYKEVEADPKLGLRVVGFIDDDLQKKGIKINGVKVLGTKKDLSKLITKLAISEVIVAIPSAWGESISEYVKICSDARIDFRIVPRVKEIIEGKAHVKTLRRVRVEDLLGRPIVKADVKELKNFFANKKVLVTGAAGSIGSELSRQIAAYRPKKLVLLDWWENGLFDLQMELIAEFPGSDIEFVIGNIQDKNKITRIFTEHRFDYVFHAAAYKHVPAMEEYPEEAVKNNVFGTLNVAREAVKIGVKKFVIVSTDKAANPKSVMGATKLLTEGIGKKLNGKTKFMAVRFGNVLDSYGSVVPIFRKQIEAGGPVTVTDKKMTRYFMTIPEASQLILKAAFMGKGGELFVLDMGDPVRIVDLAENMIRLSGYIPNDDIKIVFTGKRKGEKIKERLFNSREKNISGRLTKESKITITESCGFDINKFTPFLRNLKGLADLGDRSAIRKAISSLVKSFRA